MLKVKTVLGSFLGVLLLVALMLGTVPAQAQAQPPNATPTPEGLSADDWEQIQDEASLAYNYGQDAFLKASNLSKKDQFGNAVAVYGDTVVVAAFLEGSNATGVDGDQENELAAGSGAVYVFVRKAGVWSQQAYIKASNTEAGDIFGSSVALYADTLVVGASGEDSNATGLNGNQADNSSSSAGAVYVFTRTSTTWSQQAYLKASNTEASDGFGNAVAISGNTLVVGAYAEDSDAQGINGDQTNNLKARSGAAYVFFRNGATWSQQAYLKASNPDAGDLFGGEVAISGNTIVVGASGEDSNARGINGDQNDNSASYAGAAYVFVRNNGVWSQQAYLKASNAESDDAFGSDVSISNNTIAVGAMDESSNAQGVNGDQDNNGAEYAGAAYVFVRSDNSWSQEAYVKASNTDVGEVWEEFGADIAISGNTLVVGATHEDSDAKGVNGDQWNGGADESGAAYVYTRSAAGWSQLAYVKASNTDSAAFFSSSLAISGHTIVIGAELEDTGSLGTGGMADSGAAYIFSDTPSVEFIQCSCGVSTIANRVNYSVIFSQPVTGVDTSDFRLTTSGSIHDAKVVTVSGGPMTYTVGVDTGSGSGTIRLKIVDDDSIRDARGVPLGSAGINNGNFSISSAYVVRPLTLIFNSKAAQDGWILESSVFSGVGKTKDSTATTLRLGNDAAARRYNSILHFNTSSLPDSAIIISATLKFTKHSTVGEDPFSTGYIQMVVDIIKPYFGTSAALQLSDYQGPPNTYNHHDPIINGNIYRVPLKPSVQSGINLTGTTQFRLNTLYTSSVGADYVVFYSGDAETVGNQPALVVEYYMP
jgi:hypothetical protein